MAVTWQTIPHESSSCCGAKSAHHSERESFLNIAFSLIKLLSVTYHLCQQLLLLLWRALIVFYGASAAIDSPKRVYSKGRNLDFFFGLSEARCCCSNLLCSFSLLLTVDLLATSRSSIWSTWVLESRIYLHGKGGWSPLQFAMRSLQMCIYYNICGLQLFFRRDSTSL